MTGDMYKSSGDMAKQEKQIVYLGTVHVPALKAGMIKHIIAECKVSGDGCTVETALEVEIGELSYITTASFMRIGMKTLNLITDEVTSFFLNVYMVITFIYLLMID
jgi:hypothetical protein